MSRQSRAEASLPSEAAASLRRLGERLRDARLARGWTLKEMASRVFVTEKTLRRLEQGEPGVSLATLASALFVLGAEGGLDAVLEDDPIVRSAQRAAKRRRAPRSSGGPEGRELDF